MSSDSQNVTQLLQRWRSGDKRALDELMPLVYDDLRRSAARYLYAERPGHTLQATALVHEAYVRLIEADIDWQDRAHFYAIAARVLRRVLVEYARTHSRKKRAGDKVRIPFDEVDLVDPDAGEIISDVDDALRRLAAVDSRKSDILQLLYFGGLTYEETAAALDISPATVHRELTLAKAWFQREMAPRQ
jgi:RNA polymerase sigma factor (TIGR02999 family)